MNHTTNHAHPNRLPVARSSPAWYSYPIWAGRCRPQVVWRQSFGQRVIDRIRPKRREVPRRDLGGGEERRWKVQQNQPFGLGVWCVFACVEEGFIGMSDGTKGSDSSFVKFLRRDEA